MTTEAKRAQWRESQRLGCFTSAQLESMLTTALDAYGRAADNLRAIAAASLAATTKDPAP